MAEGELVALAIEMRRAQNTYYKGGRKREDLKASLALESQFDRAVRECEKDRKVEAADPSRF